MYFEFFELNLNVPRKNAGCVYHNFVLWRQPALFCPVNVLILTPRVIVQTLYASFQTKYRLVLCEIKKA